MRRIAVVLSGCGHRDGTEITEAVSALVALSQFGADVQMFAPDLMVAVSNHLTGEPSGERRIREEAARIARGRVRPLSDLRCDDFDGIVFPGGFGVALHLCTWAREGARCRVLPEVEQALKAFHAAQKPIGAICIAPALVARVLGGEGVSLTIGSDADTAAEIEKTGATHVSCAVDDYVTDREHKVITTPAYMYDAARPHEVFKGIHGAIKELVEMA